MLDAGCWMLDAGCWMLDAARQLIVSFHCQGVGGWIEHLVFSIQYRVGGRVEWLYCPPLFRFESERRPP
jgi:hypothetical protein